ncbi:MAG: ethanolamine permease [Actinomycetota bacterium]|nr:ethanolamine permease [Actinomycetota bacterium]
MGDARPPERRDRVAGVEYEHVGAQYLEERRLSRAAGVALIWGLGVGYVISGEYFGWNFGLAAGGFGGLLVATVLIAIMYAAMIFAIAEMATALPVSGGPYAFARRALGPWGGYITGLAVTFEYVIAPAVIAVGIGGYILGLPWWAEEAADIPFWVPYLIAAVFYAVFIGINLLGAQESLRTLFVITGISVVVLIVWGLAMLPHIDWSNLNDVAVDSERAGSSRFLPLGFLGIWAAMPAAAWFYLAIEGVPLASEEVRDPARDMPKGMILAMFSLIAFSAISLFIGPAVAGSEALGASGNPLPEAAEAAVGENWLFYVITIIGLTGLVASFFSIIFAYSRQIFALSRAGYFPRGLSSVNPRRVPAGALIIPGVIGWVVIVLVDVINRMSAREPGQSLTDAAPEVLTGDLLLQIAVFSALISYVAMMLSYIVLRVKEPDLHRPYRTPGGTVTAAIALVLALIAMGSAFVYGTKPAITISATILFFVLGLAYFGFITRHKLVAEAPEEEFAIIEKAEAELEATP